MNWMLATNILILVMISGGFVAVFLFIHDLKRNFTEFISAPSADKDSPLSQAINGLSVRFAKAMAVEVKTTMMGMLSGQARGDQALKNAEAQIDIAMDNPILAELIDTLPKNIKKMAYKNPMVTRLIMSKLGTMGGGSPAPPVSIGSGNGKAKFNL